MDSTTKTKASEANEKEPQGNGSFGAVEWLLGEICFLSFTLSLHSKSESYLQ